MDIAVKILELILGLPPYSYLEQTEASSFPFKTQPEMNEAFIRIIDFSFETINQTHLTLCIWETPKRVLLQTVKTQM